MSVPILADLLLGVAYVSESYGVVAMDQSKAAYPGVLSQLVGAVSGRDWFYHPTMEERAGGALWMALTIMFGIDRGPERGRLVAFITAKRADLARTLVPRSARLQLGAMPLSASSLRALAFLERSDSPMPRNTLGALVN